MALFELLQKKKPELTEEQRKWNKMWERWAKGQVNSPYAELMTYQSEVYNGGYAQYFTNVENTGKLQEEMAVLGTVLSEQLKDNLWKAYEAYLVLEKEENGEAENRMSRCDRVFSENEEELCRGLKSYAAMIVL